MSLKLTWILFSDQSACIPVRSRISLAMDEKLLDSPDVNLMNSLSSEWYQNVLQDSFDLQMKLAMQMERRLRSSSSIESFQSPCLADEVYSFCPSSPGIQTGSLAEISGLDKDHRRGRRYKTNNVVAQVCSRFLQKTANPRPQDLNEIVHQISHAEDLMLQETEKKLKSQVREWFRKRREYLAAKIYRSCDRLLPKAMGDRDAWTMANEVCKNETIISLISLEAKLPMQLDEEKFAFVREKIKDYYMSYPKRRLRNGLIARKSMVNPVTEVQGMTLEIEDCIVQDGDKFIDDLMI